MKILRKHLEVWHRHKDVDNYLHLQKEARKKLEKEYMKIHHIKKVYIKVKVKILCSTIECYCKNTERGKG